MYEYTGIFLFAGSSSATITDTPHFTRALSVLCRHEALSVAGRQDMSQLIARHVSEGTMTEELARSICEDAENLFGGVNLDQYIHGSTYVGVADSMTLHLNSKNSSVPAYVKRKLPCGTFAEKLVNLWRSWGPVTNFLQTEDMYDYGSPFSPIPQYRGVQNQAMMMLWVLSSLISGCKELHSGIDKKTKPFRYDEWAGHMLAHIHNHCVKSDENRTPRGSPFRPTRDNSFILDVLEKSMPFHYYDFDYDDTGARNDDVETNTHFFR